MIPRRESRSKINQLLADVGITQAVRIGACASAAGKILAKLFAALMPGAFFELETQSGEFAVEHHARIDGVAQQYPRFAINERRRPWPFVPLVCIVAATGDPGEIRGISQQQPVELLEPHVLFQQVVSTVDLLDPVEIDRADFARGDGFKRYQSLSGHGTLGLRQNDEGWKAVSPSKVS